MKQGYVLGAAIAALMASASFAHAQENPTSPQTPAVQERPVGTPPATEPSVLPGKRIETQDFKSWIGLKVETLDGQNVGEIAEVLPATGTNLEEVHADIGGFLGFGETRVKLMPGQLTKQGDKVIVSLTKDEVKKLPKIVS